MLFIICLLFHVLKAVCLFSYKFSDEVHKIVLLKGSGWIRTSQPVFFFVFFQRWCKSSNSEVKPCSINQYYYQALPWRRNISHPLKLFLLYFICNLSEIFYWYCFGFDSITLDFASFFFFFTAEVINRMHLKHSINRYSVVKPDA